MCSCLNMAVMVLAAATEGEAAIRRVAWHSVLPVVRVRAWAMMVKRHLSGYAADSEDTVSSVRGEDRLKQSVMAQLIGLF